MVNIRNKYFCDINMKLQTIHFFSDSGIHNNKTYRVCYSGSSEPPRTAPTRNPETSILGHLCPSDIPLNLSAKSAPVHQLAKKLYLRTWGHFKDRTPPPWASKNGEFPDSRLSETHPWQNPRGLLRPKTLRPEVEGFLVGAVRVGFWWPRIAKRALVLFLSCDYH